jgi:alkylresorcinol/alkylpyrone synthase
MGLPKVLSVGTAVPPFALSQEEIRRFAAGLFRSNYDHIDRLLPVFDNGFIKTRHLSQPLEWYADEHTFAESNHIFRQVALELAEKASRQAIEKAGIQPTDIAMVVFATSTGIATPTLDAKLMQRLGIPGRASRLPIWGLGCGGGVAGLARASELSVSRPSGCVLMVAVELCSLTFQRNDYSKSNIVGSSIFSDGAAAAIVSLTGEGLEVHGSYSNLFPDTEDIMGWDLVESGLKVRFSRDIPSIVREYLPGLIVDACRKWDIDPTRIRHYVVHPGGAKVLSAYSESLGLPANNLESAYEVLGDYGNMSSASVLFVLERFLAATPPSGDYGLMLALGPGFSAEQVLFRW